EEIPFEAEILNTQVDFVVKDGVLYGKVIIEVLEDIVEQRILQIGED
ncbi:MAG: sporulation protein YqfD, partial [Clostridiales bacterium]|nr:sporulation protein YqfD [Clostridiales bacterium]